MPIDFTNKINLINMYLIIFILVKFDVHRNLDEIVQYFVSYARIKKTCWIATMQLGNTTTSNLLNSVTIVYLYVRD